MSNFINDANDVKLNMSIDSYKFIKKYKLFRREFENNSYSKGYSPAEGERIGDYCIKGLYKVIYDLSGMVYSNKFKNLDHSKRFECLAIEFNRKFAPCTENYIFDNDDKFIKVEPDLFDGLFLTDCEREHAKRLIKEFSEAYNNLRNNDESTKKYFSINDAETYLEKYLNLCRFVFNDRCLNQEELRSLKVIETLLNIDFHESKSCFGLYSPYVVFSILRILKYISILPDEIDCSNLSQECINLNTRKHIISTNAIRSFSRFTIIDGKSYVIDYSRRNDCIVCKSVESISSVDNIKPIRLFEKITSYIYNFFKDNKSLKSSSFVISIYGFCSYKDAPEEIDDLVYEIFSWFEEKR